MNNIFVNNELKEISVCAKIAHTIDLKISQKRPKKPIFARKRQKTPDFRPKMSEIAHKS